MWELTKVAARNVGRNKRRAIITMFTVFIGVTVVLSARALLNGLQGEFKSGLIRKMHGELQIHHAGYQDSVESNPFKILIPYNTEFINKLKSNPNVMDVTPRLRVMGLLNHQKSQTTTPILISAIEPESELKVCPRLRDALQLGSLLDASKEKSTESIYDENLEEASGINSSISVDQIEPLNNKTLAAGTHQILVTPSLLRGLQANVGDEVVALLQDKDNMQQALVAHIVGVIDFALPNAQARMAWMDFKTLQDTLHLQGLTSEVAIRTFTDENLEKTKSELQISLGQDHIVETWLDLGGFFRDIMNIQDSIFNAVLFVIFLIVISAIVNTSLMTVMERTREIGTLMALGYRRFHIIYMFLCESVVIGISGGTLSILFVMGILKIISSRGIIFPLPGESIPVSIYPFLKTSFIFEVFFLALSAAILASFYPSYRASRMKPVQALSAV